MSLEGKVQVKDLGKIGYSFLEELQAQLVRERSLSMIPDTMLVATHPPTLTTGINERWNVIHTDEDELRRLGIGRFYSQRGGGATILGPGQLAFYPVVNIGELGISSEKYLRIIEESVFEVAQEMGAKGTFLGQEHNSATGKPYVCVWNRGRERNEKFLAQGIKVDRRTGMITNGGFAIYLDKRAHQYFHLIDPCGFNSRDVGATSFSEMLGEEINERELKKRIIDKVSGKLGHFRRESSQIYVGETA